MPNHGQGSITTEDAADHRRQFIVVVCGEASSRVAEHLAAEIGIEYIDSTSTKALEECTRSSSQVEVLAAACREASEQVGIAILAVPEYTFPLKQLRRAVPKDFDVRFVICGVDGRAGTFEEECGCHCLKVMLDDEYGGVEAVIRRIEADFWGAGS